MEPILNVNGLTMDFGGIRALDKLDLRIHVGEIVALIGPNGAGKTTFFNCLTGIYSPTAGELLLSPPNKTQRIINGCGTTICEALDRVQGTDKVGAVKCGFHDLSSIIRAREEGSSQCSTPSRRR